MEGFISRNNDKDTFRLCAYNLNMQIGSPQADRGVSYGVNIIQIHVVNKNKRIISECEWLHHWQQDSTEPDFESLNLKANHCIYRFLINRTYAINNSKYASHWGWEKVKRKTVNANAEVLNMVIHVCLGYSSILVKREE